MLKEKLLQMRQLSPMERINKVKPYTIMMVIPLLFTLLFGGAISQVFVQDVPIALYDMDNSAESRQVRDQLLKYPYFAVDEGANSIDEIEDEFLYGHIVGAVIIPEGFGADVKAKRGGDILVMQDTCNFMNMSGVMTGISSVAGTVNAGIRIQLMEAGGMTPTAAYDTATTLSVIDRGLYNPTYGYLYFLVPMLLAIFTQQTYLAAASLYLTQRKKQLAIGELTLPQVVAQLLVYIVCGTIGLMICLFTLDHLFDYPIRGSLGSILLTYLPFMVAMTGMVLVISAIFDDDVHCTQFNMFLTIPLLLSCGYAWPEFMMPEAFRWIITKIWPLYYWANPLHDIMLKGADLAQVAPYIQGVLWFALFWLPVGIVLYARKIRRIRRDAAAGVPACQSDCRSDIQ